jgi:hypothetical protein
MASTLDPKTTHSRGDSKDSDAAAVIDAAELEAARDDPRVQAFFEEADAYVTDLERQGRNS